jgi:micrococcal nuclease
LSVLQNGNGSRSNPLPTLHEPALIAKTLGITFLFVISAARAPAGSDATAQKIAQNERIECRVTRISDGDTIYCGNEGRIRLLMIDAPELSQGTAGKEAQKTLAHIMPVGTAVSIETDIQQRDTYGRILGYIYLRDGRMVNEVMARSGYVTALVYPPNVKYVERIRSAVRDAQQAKRGLWATDFFKCSPRDYRAGRCGGGKRRDSRNRYRPRQSGSS